MLFLMLFFWFQTPSPIDPPAGQKLILTYQARGVQVYSCEPAANDSFQWTFDRPEAELMNEKSEQMGRHFAGPSWESFDGSRLTGKVAARQPSPEGAIPWLLLSADTHSGTGYGVFQHVEFIQRINTKGGTAPATGCDATHLHQKSRVPYTATYTFFRGQS